MKKIFLTAFVAFLLHPALFSQSVQEGLRFMEIDKVENAKKVFKNLYKQNATAENAFYLGDLYYQIEKMDSAFYYFNTGVKADANYPMNYVGLGKISYSANPTEGKKNFDKALELSKSKNPVVLNAIADFYIKYDKLEVPKAFTYLESALKHDPKNITSYILKGDGFWRIADGSKAVEQYEKALTLNVKYPMSLMKLGESYKFVKNYSRSLDYYKKVLALDSLYAPVYKEMGDVYYRSKQYDKAIESYKKYVYMADHNDDVDLKYASFLIMNRDFNNALTLLKRLETKEDINTSTYRLLGYAYYEKGENDKGIQNMEKFLSKTDAKKLIAADYEYYGKMLAKAGKDSLAAENLEASLGIDSSRFDLYGDLGNVYLQMGKYSKAANALEKKIKKSGNTQDYYNLGLSYFYSQKFAEADTTFGTLIKYLPNYPLGYFWKAKAKSGLDPNCESGLAKPYFEKFIDLTQNEIAKNKKDLLTAYDYLGYYYLLRKDKHQAKEAYTKMKEIDPGNKKADNGLKIVNK